MSALLAGKLTQINLKSKCLASFTLIQGRHFSETKDSNIAVVDVKDSKKTDNTETSSALATLKPVDISCITGIPEEHIKERTIRLYLKPKNAMQSGTHNSDCWELEFDNRERWENPLMGWASTGDPLSNIKLQFYDKDSAISFAEKHGYNYYIEAEKKVKPKVKSYGFNFSWNKRTRVSTK